MGTSLFARTGHRRGWLCTTAILVVATALAGCGQDDVEPTSNGEFDAEEFFSGKTIDVIIGSPTGGAGDATARLIIDALDGKIPGDPQFRPTNVDDIPGIARVYDAPDGDLVVGQVSRGAELYATMLQEGATHDIENIQIVGGFGANTSATGVFGDAAESYDGLEDASGSSEPPFLFSEVVGDPTQVIGSAYFISWLCDTFDLPCELTNVADADLETVTQDIERGTVNMVETTTAGLVRSYFDQFESGSGEILVEYGEEGSDEVISPFDQPRLEDMFPSDEAQEEFENMLPLIGFGGVGHPWFSGPSFPEEAMEVLRDAYAEALRDPETVELVAAARAGELPGVEYNMNVISGTDAQEAVDEAAEKFFAHQSDYKERQQEWYETYWK